MKDHYSAIRWRRSQGIHMTLKTLMNLPALSIRCDVMAQEAIDHVVDNLVGCAVSLSAYSLVTDLNTKLALLQQINKEYNALVHKLESEIISQQDLNVAAPVAKEKVSSEIHRRDDFGLDSETSEKLVKSTPSKVDQIINFLLQNRNLEIHATFAFKEPAE